MLDSNILNDIFPSQICIFGLKQPWLACAPDEFNEDEWQWKYKIRTVDIEGDGGAGDCGPRSPQPTLRDSHEVLMAQHDCKQHLQEAVATAEHPYRYVIRVSPMCIWSG